VNGFAGYAVPLSIGEPAATEMLRELVLRDDQESMVGGSRHDRTQHSGSRDVTEGVTGGLGTEVGGSRNLRQGTGHTGGDIGNRPE